MTGNLSQIVTLTTFGNDYLKNGKLPVDFYPNNTSFQFCNKVDFREFKSTFFFKKLKEIVIAENPNEWFKYLKRDGCKKLRLYFQSSKDQSMAKDHKLAGMVGGGGTWLIEAVYDTYSNGWANRWSVTKQDDPDHKIWTVNYGMTVKKLPTIDLQIDQTEIKLKLKQTLTEIADFALKHNLKTWRDLFVNAKSNLESDTWEEPPYHKNFIPLENYSTIAKQILFSANSAWVFGGMGSWNDLSFKNEEDNNLYEKLSEQLYSQVNEAIISVTNSY